MKLDKDVFVALASIIWADGVVTGDEARALEEAARACGVDAAGLEEVRAATRQRQSLERVKDLGLGADERCFVYAIAAWLARADGVVTPEETEALAHLGDMLEVGDDDRACALAASHAIDVHYGGMAGNVRALADDILAINAR